MGLKTRGKGMNLFVRELLNHGLLLDQLKRQIFLSDVKIRDGSKFIGYPGQDHRQGGEDFFSKKIGGRRLFFEKI